jgi:hypothetical protein
LSKKSIGGAVFGSVSPFLLSQKSYQVFISEKIKGILSMTKVEAVHARTKKKTELFLPSLMRGTLLFDEGGFKRDGEVCPVCHTGGIIKYFQNLVIIKNSWNDLEIFVPPPLPGIVIVNEKFVE